MLQHFPLGLHDVCVLVNSKRVASYHVEMQARMLYFCFNSTRNLIKCYCICMKVNLILSFKIFKQKSSIWLNNLRSNCMLFNLNTKCKAVPQSYIIWNKNSNQYIFSSCTNHHKFVIQRADHHVTKTFGNKCRTRTYWTTKITWKLNATSIIVISMNLKITSSAWMAFWRNFIHNILVVCKLSVLFGTIQTTAGWSAQMHHTKRINRKYWFIKQIWTAKTDFIHQHYNTCS